MDLEDSLFDDDEYSYLNEIQTTSRCTLVFGNKGSGKTFLFLNILRFLIINQKANGYNQFHLVIPSYKNEQNDSYKFLKDLPNNYKKNVFIYNKYNDLVTEMVFKKQRGSRSNHEHSQGSGNENKCLFLIDDATGSFVESFHKEDNKMTEILTQSRHLRINLVVIGHYLSGAFKPLYRALFDFLFVFNVSNSRLLQTTYQEFLSLITNDTYNEFRKKYNNNIKNIKYSFLFINNLTSTYTFTNPNEWTVNKLIDVNNLGDFI